MARRVLVTGGSRGIGAACVEYFAAQGAHVCFLYHSREDAAAEVSAKTGAEAFRADLGDPVQAQTALDAAITRLGGADVLVSNAGISQFALFTELGDDDWQRMIGVNLSGAFYAARAAAREMVRAHSGRIIFIGSMWGKTGASCEVHYSASKAALRGMTQALAKELGPSGITVNCVEPGVIATEMNASLSRETLESLREETPVGRIGTPQDVARAVGFFAAPQADFITGQILGVDGGFAV